MLAGRPQRGVGCLERLAPDRAGDGGEGDDGIARGLAARIAAEQLGVERERARRVGEPLAAELGEPRDEVGVEAAREPGLERSRELGGPIEPLEEPLERRAGVGVVGGEPSHLAPRCGRPGAVCEPRLRDGRLLAQRVLALRGVRGAARELGADVRELAPALASPVEPPQRRERLAVARRGHEHARPGGGGALGVEPPVGEVGLLAQEGGAELRRSLLAQVGVQLRAGLELLALGGEPAQVATRVRVRRVSPHRRRDRGEGERHLVQLLLRHARRATERGRLRDRLRPDARLRLERPHAAARVGVGGEPGGGDEDRPRVLARRAAPRARPARRRPAGSRRGRRRAALRRRGDRRSPARSGRPRAPRATPPRDPASPGRARASASARPAAIARRAERLGEPGEEPRAVVGRRGATASRSGGGRGGGIAEPLREHLGALGEEGGPLGALRGRGARLEQLGGLGPLLRRERGARERGEGRRVAGAQRERAAEVRGRLVEGAEILLGDRGGAHAQRELLVGPPLQPAGGVGEQREQLAVGAHLARERLAAPACVGVLGARPEGGGGGRERARASPSLSACSAEASSRWRARSRGSAVAGRLRAIVSSIAAWRAASPAAA